MSSMVKSLPFMGPSLTGCLIIFLADGRIAEEGTHESLLKLNGEYAKLFEIQSRYYREGGDHDGE